MSKPTVEEVPDANAPPSDRPVPLVVDLDGTLLRSDTLYESFAAALFRHPLAALRSLGKLFGEGIAPFKRAISELAIVDPAFQPIRQDLLEHLREEHRRSRPLHLITAADRLVAAPFAKQFAFFESVSASDGILNLNSEAKAVHLVARFPDGFAYAGKSSSDLAVWRFAASAIVVSKDSKLSDKVRAMAVPVEQEFRSARPTARDWIKAFRVHQWSKNLLVILPVALGWSKTDPQGAAATLIAVILLCALASLTYCLNDIGDLAADRQHWSKRFRPFASGAIPVRDGLLLAGLGIPIVIGLGFLVAPVIAACLVAYVAVTLGYSFGLKRIPILDTFVIAVLFTLRIALGIGAGRLEPSSWLLTFSMFFFFSLAVAKRHTELLRTAQGISGPIEGRGYHVEDKDLTLALGVAASMASILIVVIYLVDEVLARATYAHPAWLWVTPCTVFLWVSRVWLLAHRGLMRDDPVVFALKDRISLCLGVVTVAGFLAAAL